MCSFFCVEGIFFLFFVGVGWRPHCRGMKIDSLLPSSALFIVGKFCMLAYWLQELNLMTNKNDDDMTLQLNAYNGSSMVRELLTS